MGDVVEMPAASPPAQAQESQPLSADELGKRVLKASDLEVAELLSLPFEEKYEIAGAAWQHGESPPGNASLLVVALFVGDQHDLREDHVTGDVRAYVMPRSATTGDGAAKQEYRLYTLNRAAPTIRVTRMNLETFVEEIGGEWHDLAVLRGVVEEEDDEEPDT